MPFPPNAYQGDYVRDMAEQMKIAHGDKLVRPRTTVLDGTPGLPDADAPMTKPRRNAKPTSMR